MKEQKVYQNGFTLIEMLVVIAVIALLAALLFPAVDSALRRARQTRCMNNLRNFGIAWNTYYLDVIAGPRGSDLEAVQPWLSAMMPEFISDPGMFVCPSDRSRGTWGSKPAGVGESEEFRTVDTGDFPETNDMADNPATGAYSNRNDDVEAHSYLYEFCEAEVSWTWDDYVLSGRSDGSFASIADVDLNQDGRASWGEVKLQQLQYGDKSSGRGYDRGQFPLVRCFNHYTDKKVSVRNFDDNRIDRTFRVLNVAVNGNVFLSGLKWEYPLAP